MRREAEEVTPKELEKVVVEVDEKVPDIDDLAPGGASAELNVEKEEEDNVRLFSYCRAPYP